MKKISILLGTMVAAFLAFPAARAQNAYVANSYPFNNLGNSVSVIDTSNNKSIATLPLGVTLYGGSRPEEVAISPDGTRAYVNSILHNYVWVIDANPLDSQYNKVVATVTVGSSGRGIAVTPDGTRAYVANYDTDNLSVIDTSTETVSATVGLNYAGPGALAITPDGTRAYVVIAGGNTTGYEVRVVDTNPADSAYNSVVGDVTVGRSPQSVAITPDGTRAYVLNGGNGDPSTVSVIDTNTADSTTYNQVIATISLGSVYYAHSIAITPDGTRAYVTAPRNPSVTVIDINPADVKYNLVAGTVVPPGDGFGNAWDLAFTPDGTRAYVTEHSSTKVAVVDTNPASTTYNRAVDEVTVGIEPWGIAIQPFDMFSAFSAKLDITAGTSPGFQLKGAFTLGGANPSPIDPTTEAVTLKVGTYSVSIPPGSFQQQNNGNCSYTGTIGGATLQIIIKSTGASAYSFSADASGVDLTTLNNPVTVTLTVGIDSGTIPVTAQF